MRIGTGQMFMNVKKLILAIVIIAVTAGCAVNTLLNGNQGQTEPAGNSMSIFSKEPSDKELFNETLSLLHFREGEPDYQEAKIRLEKLIARYPKSKWSVGAQALILTLDSISALQAKLKAEQTSTQNDHAKLMREIDWLKDNAKKTEEKYMAEMTRLQQENEQLKKDIEQLKKLEIRLEKREKMMR